MITNTLPSAALLLQQVAVNDAKRNKKRYRNLPLPKKWKNQASNTQNLLEWRKLTLAQQQNIMDELNNDAIEKKEKRYSSVLHDIHC